MIIVIDNTAWPEAIKQQDWKPENIAELRGNNDVTVTLTIFSVYPEDQSSKPFVFASIASIFFLILLSVCIFLLLRYLKDLKKLKMLNQLINSKNKVNKQSNENENIEKDVNKKKPLLSI